MTSEYNIAVNEMLGLFNVAWLAQSEAIAGYVPEIRWQGKEEKDKPQRTKFWVRVSTQNVSEEQTSLSAFVGANSPASRFTPYGLVLIQIFCPKDNTGFKKGKLLATVAKKAYRGKKTDGGVWFRNVRVNELDNDDLWYRFNVIAEYEYDEVG